MEMQYNNCLQLNFKLRAVAFLKDVRKNVATV